MTKKFIALGSLNAMICVMSGAFGAHALQSKLSTHMLSVYETAVQYHFYHSLGLISIGILYTWQPNNTMLKFSGWIMLTGITIFSGSLYTLALTNMTWLGIVTPFGGICLIISWLLFSLSILRMK